MKNRDLAEKIKTEREIKHEDERRTRESRLKRQRESDIGLIGLIFLNKDAVMMSVGVCLCVRRNLCRVLRHSFDLLIHFKNSSMVRLVFQHTP